MVVVVVVPTTLVSEDTGTGISWPLAMIAFLLLLVKTIGREITRKRPVDSSTNDRRECVSGGEIDVCSGRRRSSPDCVKLISPCPGLKIFPPVVIVVGVPPEPGTGVIVVVTPPPASGGIPVKFVVAATFLFARRK